MPGSGKTTIAQALEREHNAVRLASDVWMARIALDGWDETRRATIAGGGGPCHRAGLPPGASLVLGAFVARNRPLDDFVAYGDRSSPFAVTPEQLDAMWPHFEPPGADEL